MDELDDETLRDGLHNAAKRTDHTLSKGELDAICRGV
jgi:hypothetical protein